VSEIDELISDNTKLVEQVNALKAENAALKKEKP
jgi:cell division protein FtsB